MTFILLDEFVAPTLSSSSSATTPSFDPTLFPPTHHPTFSKILVNSETSGHDGETPVYASSCYDPNIDVYFLNTNRKEVVYFTYSVRLAQYSDPAPVLSSLEKEIQDDVTKLFLDCGSAAGMHISLPGIERISSAPVDRVDTNSACSSISNEIVQVVDYDDCYIVEGGMTFTWSNNDNVRSEEDNLNLKNTTFSFLRKRMDEGEYDGIHENITMVSFHTEGNAMATASIVAQEQNTKIFSIGNIPITMAGGFALALVGATFLSVLIVTVWRRKRNKRKRQMFDEESVSSSNLDDTIRKKKECPKSRILDFSTSEDFNSSSETNIRTGRTTSHYTSSDGDKVNCLALSKKNPLLISTRSLWSESGEDNDLSTLVRSKSDKKSVSFSVPVNDPVKFGVFKAHEKVNAKEIYADVIDL